MYTLYINSQLGELAHVQATLFNAVYDAPKSIHFFLSPFIISFFFFFCFIVYCRGSLFLKLNCDHGLNYFTEYFHQNTETGINPSLL